MSNNITKPSIYKDNWLVFSDTILSDISDTNCIDTINGTCYYDKSIDDCIDICSKNKDLCDYGYYVKKDKSICVPLLNVNSYINPIDKIIKNTKYKIPIYTFINNNTYKFPNVKSNIVYIGDTLLLENTDTNTLMDIITSNNLDKAIFSKKGESVIQIIPPELSQSKIPAMLPVKFGTNFIYTLPETNLILRASDAGKMEWISRFIGNSQLDNIQMLPVDSSSKLGDDITYDDSFYLSYKSINIIGVNDTGEMVIYYEPYKNIKNTANVTFKFKSLMNGYYCENNECKQIPLYKTNTKKELSTYNGKDVTRNSGCFGMCNKTILPIKTNSPSSSPPSSSNKYLIYMIVVIISIVLLIIKIGFYYLHRSS